MRNPIRLKNLRMRFVPFYLAGGLLLWGVRPAPLEYAIGVVAVGLGAALRTWGAGHLVKTARLTVTGPYARVRHPLYVGTLLCGSGLALMVGGVWGAGVLAVFLAWFFGAYFPRKERLEAARLEQRYGEVFVRYRAEVPALLPRLAPWTPPAHCVGPADPDRCWSFARYAENNELGTLLALFVSTGVFTLRVVAGS